VANNKRFFRKPTKDPMIYKFMMEKLSEEEVKLRFQNWLKRHPDGKP